MTHELIDSWKKHWLMWRDYPNNFRKYLTELQASLQIDVKFKDLAPISLIGDWTRTENKLFIGSLNPSSKIKKYHSWESDKRGFDFPVERRKNLTWDMQIEFCQKIFFQRGNKHYTNLGRVVSDYNDFPNLTRDEKYQLLHEQAIFGELLPFYSDSFTLSTKANENVLRDIWNTFSEFVNNAGFSTYLLNGISVYKVFLEKGWIIPVGPPTQVLATGSISNLQLIAINGFHGVLSPFISRIPNPEISKVTRMLHEAEKMNNELP